MRVVVIGLGWVAVHVWLPRLLAHADYTVVAAVEPDPDAAARAVTLLAGRPVYTDHREVPLDGVDCVFVLTPNDTHAEIGSWFLRHGLAVVLEKPPCIHPADIETLAEAAAAGGGRLGLSAAARHRADVAALRHVVRSGGIGTPRVAELSWVRARGVPQGAWSSRLAQAGGGVLFDLGWHVIDVVMDLWGPVRVSRAAVHTSADFLSRTGSGASWHGPGGPTLLGGDVEDQLHALVATDRYALSLRFAWASHESVDETAIVLYGTDATAELRTTFGFSPRRRSRPSLRLKQDGTVTRPPVDRDTIGAEYDRQLSALAGLAGDSGATERSLAAARSVMEIVNACYEAVGRERLAAR